MKKVKLTTYAKLINADVNGALNILRKVIGNYNYGPIKVCSTPLILEPTN